MLFSVTVRDLVRQLNGQPTVAKRQTDIETTPTRPHPKSKPPTPQRTTSHLTSQESNSKPESVTSPLLTQAKAMMTSSERKEREGDAQAAVAFINQAIGEYNDSHLSCFHNVTRDDVTLHNCVCLHFRLFTTVAKQRKHRSRYARASATASQQCSPQVAIPETADPHPDTNHPFHSQNLRQVRFHSLLVCSISLLLSC